MASVMTGVAEGPQVGEPAPDVTMRRDDGSEFTLSQLWQNGPAVLVFLRYFGCTFCREHIAQLRHDEARFRELETTIALISLGTPEATAEFCASRASEEIFICLSDMEKQAYRAFGLRRVDMAHLMTPHVWARGIQNMLHGYFAGMPKGDINQLPGVFIIDREGIIRYAHRHKDASDNPPNAELLDVLASLS